MARKKGNFIELYIEKIVLGVSIVLSLVILWFLVLSGPHSVEYGGKKYGPGQIDQIIKQQVSNVQERLDEPVVRRSYEQSHVEAFKETFESPIQGISNNVYYPLPPYGVQTQTDGRTYEIPHVGYVFDPEIDVIRTVAHVPIEEVNPKTSYESAETELGDIDIVTVQSSFNVVSLYKNFGNSFSGNRVRGDWRDAELAKPVFAGVELQRRKQLDDGNWGQWTRVSRTKIDHLRTLLEVPEDADGLEYGIDFTLSRFREHEMQKGLLQPEAYEFATNADEWLPPEYHKELTVLLKRERVEAKRLERERKKATREAAKQARQAKKQSRGGMGAMGGMMGPGGGGGRTRTQGKGRRANQRDKANRRETASKKPKKEENTIAKIFDEYEERLLEEDTRLASLRKPLIFWAHDDTIELGNTYQYRIRLGVFNPIVGKNWFVEAQKDLEEQVVLWTEFSDVTESVYIPEMMHLFPLEMSKEVDDTVELKVAKFHHGQWRTHDFTVRPGQKIGHSVEDEPDEKKNPLDDDNYGTRKSDDEDEIVKEIDFSTDAVLLDIVRANVWSGANALNPISYSDMLYTEDGENVKHLAIKSKNWPKDIQKELSRIKQSEEESIMIFYARGSGGVDRTGKKRSTPTPMGMPGMMGPMGMPGMMGPMMN